MHETHRFPRPFGKYLLLRQLAVGGMAEVYLARQSGPAGFQKECVIKRILPALAADQQFVNMFLDEARIAALLSHPNIVQIFDLGAIGEGDYFLAMEHVHGVDLQQLEEAERRRGGRVPLAIAVRIASNVAEGLEHAHRATDARGQPLGLVHRDVTPSNVIVSFDGVAKILDFGIAQAAAKRGRTEVGVIKGKVPYMSPEQVQGEPLDSRSDIFSLGTMLYELTTGHKPFDGEGLADLSLKILQQQPPAPATYIDAFPPPLASIIWQALGKRPEERFSSARELHEALEEFLLQAGVRCTSHDVAAYLDDLFPGLRERARQEAAALPAEATDPTMAMRNMRDPDGPQPLHEESPSLSLGELSAPRLGSYEEVSRNLGPRRGGGSTAVMVLLVAGVALGFWYLATRHGAAATSPTAGGVVLSPPAGLPAPKSQAAAPAATPPTPTEAAARALPPSVPTATRTPATTRGAAAPTSPATTQKPAAPAAIEASAAPSRPKAEPAAAEPAHRGKRAHRPHRQAEVELPRLPEPPPPDDQP